MQREKLRMNLDLEVTVAGGKYWVSASSAWLMSLAEYGICEL